IRERPEARPVDHPQARAVGPEAEVLAGPAEELRLRDQVAAHDEALQSGGDAAIAVVPGAAPDAVVPQYVAGADRAALRPVGLDVVTDHGVADHVPLDDIVVRRLPAEPGEQDPLAVAVDRVVRDR